MAERDIVDDYSALAEAADAAIAAVRRLGAVRAAHESDSDLTFEEAVAFAIDKLSNELDRDFDGSDVCDMERATYREALRVLRASNPPSVCGTCGKSAGEHEDDCPSDGAESA